MFFFLSKILYFLIQPVNWVIGCMAAAIWTKNPKKKQRRLWWALGLTLFLTNHFIFNEVVRLWEVRTITADEIVAPYDIGIVLGGYTNSNIIPDHDRHNFNEFGSRFFQALELYQTGKIRKLLLSGGSGSLVSSGFSEARQMADYLLRMGIPKEDLLLETQSRNTYENAVFSARLIREKYPEARCLLITSAWHMRRSRGCFRRTGLRFTPFSVNFLSERRRFLPDTLLIPKPAGFFRWELIVKEWVGYVAYWLTGKL
ncbi:MAG: YdcF family protein [Bacteroidetes bacterium]|nr:MAG: YdcF family protein [Bacteroidota bacterium]